MPTPTKAHKIIDKIFICLDVADPTKLKFVDTNGVDAKAAHVKRGKKLVFFSRVAAFAICFNKGYGSPSATETGLFGEKGKDAALQISSDTFENQQFHYSVCLFIDGKQPICEDPQIIITS